MTLSVQKTQVTLLSRKALNSTYIEIELQLSEIIDFKAGQYINLRIGNTFRAYSVASVPNKQGVIVLCIDTKPEGIGSNFAKSAPIGTKIEALFPLGHFTIQPASGPAWFIATGSGISPFYAMITEALQQKREVCLVWGMRYVDDLFWQKNWNQLKLDYLDLFSVKYCLSQETNTNESMFFAGRVTDYLDKQTIDKKSQVYICGNKEMVMSIDGLMKQKGVDSKNIFFEKYY